MPDLRSGVSRGRASFQADGSALTVLLLDLPLDVLHPVDVLGAPNVRSMRTVFVRPLALRAEAIPRLLDRLLAERGTILRVADLTPPNQSALQTYAWPGNLTDLQSAADRLIAIARDGSLLKASKALGVSNSTLHYWFGQVGMSLPLVAAG